MSAWGSVEYEMSLFPNTCGRCSVISFVSSAVGLEHTCITYVSKNCASISMEWVNIAPLVLI